MGKERSPNNNEWKLVWNDEFDGDSIDAVRWQPCPEPWEHPGFKTRLAEENCFLDGDGHLVIRLTRDADGTIAYSNGLVSRSFQKAFDYIEARVQFSTQPGWWTSVCTIRNNTVPNYGHDPFENPQEFDIYEDFYKPKIEPSRPVELQQSIHQAYHCTVDLGFQDQGDGSGVTAWDARKKDMLAVNKVSRAVRTVEVTPKEYAGWHTVGLRWGPLEQVFYLDEVETFRQTYKDTPITTVPQKLMICGVCRTPKVLKKDGGPLPFYGFLEDAALPDQVVVDYVRWYAKDTEGRTVSTVALTLEGDPNKLRPGRPATFRVHADAGDGRLQSVQLFAKGYLRAEATPDAAQCDQAFTITNLFEGDNTLIATAVGNDGLVGLSAPVRVKVIR